METNDIVSKTIAAYDAIAEKYASKSLIYDMSAQYGDFLSVLPGKRILDVGCGSGRDVQHLSQKGLAVLGIDLSEKLLQSAKKYAPDSDFLQMDMRRLAFRGKSLDGIWSCGSLLHLPKSDAKNMLLEYRRVLKDHCGMYLSVKIGDGEEWIGEEHPRFYSQYQPQELWSLTKAAGFSVHKAYETLSKTDVRWINLLCKSTKS